MNLFYEDGIVVNSGGYRIILDPHRIIPDHANTIVGVSHAHSDHLKNHKASVLSTKQTFDLAYYDLRKIEVGHNKSFKFDGTEITLRNANHVLGSSQFEIRTPEEAIVYTGDFKLHESPFFEPCYIPQCDTLVVESTYGQPHFKFPEFDQVSGYIRSWVWESLAQNKNVLFGGYSLGKSQELIRILNDIGIIPVVHPKIAKVSDVYKDNGIKLSYINSASEEGKELMKHQFIGVMPSNLLNSAFFESFKSQTDRQSVSAFATGWGTVYKYSGVDMVFPLSDHCDFYQLLDYVEKTGAKKVFTVHGYDRELAAEIRRRLKVQARPLHSNQLRLEEFE